MVEIKQSVTEQESNFCRPHKVRLEACTFCQLDCVLCYMRKGETSLKNGYLSFDNFKKFVDDNDFVDCIELSNSGEIFLNPDLLEIIKYSYDKGIRLTAYNGVNLNNVSDEVLEALVKYKFEKITVSLDGASQETYSQYRRKGDFDKVIGNIKKINSYKKQYKTKFPLLKYQFIIFGYNEHEIPEAKKLAEELGMEINFKLNWTKNWSPLKDVEFVKRECPDIYKNARTTLHNCCVKMWTQPQINWDGRLFGCCINTSSDFGVNVFELGLEKALKSEKYLSAKNLLLGKEPDGEWDFSCAKCGFYKKMRENGNFVTQNEISDNFYN